MSHEIFRDRRLFIGASAAARIERVDRLSRGRGVPHSVENFPRSSGPHHNRRPPERALAPDCEPPLGAHVVTPRFGYTHHGIYAGQGRIMQYGGLSRGLGRGPVEEVSLAQFCQGRPIRIRMEESYWHDPTAVVHRARLRLGENRYHLLKNNCEHFCEWCVHGEHRSYQVEELIGRCALMWHHVIETAARALLRRRQAAMGPQPRRLHNAYQ